MSKLLLRILAGASLLLALQPLTAVATTVVPPRFDELVNESDYIVRAVVKTVTAERRTRNGSTKIYTRVELEVKEVIAGTPPSPLVLSMLGGRIDNEEMEIEGAPKFKVGDEDILFVRDNGKSISPLTAMMHGRYPIKKDPGSGREFVTRSNDVPLNDTAEVALPMTGGALAQLQRQAKTPAGGLTPAEFTQRIRATVNPSTSRTLLH